MDFLIIWMSPLSFLGTSGIFLRFCLTFRWKSLSKENRPRKGRHVLRRHICNHSFFYLLLRQSISDHYLRSCGYVTCSRPQRKATEGLEPGASRPKVLGFPTALVCSTVCLCSIKRTPGLNVLMSTLNGNVTNEPNELSEAPEMSTLPSIELSTTIRQPIARSTRVSKAILTFDEKNTNKTSSKLLCKR